MTSARRRSDYELTKTLHTSPSRASYGVSYVSILEKNNRAITQFDSTYVTARLYAIQCYSELTRHATGPLARSQWGLSGHDEPADNEVISGMSKLSWAIWPGNKYIFLRRVFSAAWKAGQLPWAQLRKHSLLGFCSACCYSGHGKRGAPSAGRLLSTTTAAARSTGNPETLRRHF